MFISLSVLLLGERIQWRGSYEAARHEAIDTGRDLIVLAVKPKCQPCNSYIHKISQDPRIISIVNKKYIAVIVTCDKIRAYPNELYYTLKYPALFLVDPKEESFLSTPLDSDMLLDLNQTRRVLAQKKSR